MRYSEDDYDKMKCDLKDDLDALRAVIIQAEQHILIGKVLVVALAALCVYLLSR